MNANIVTREEWLQARKAHLKSEKALTRMHDLVIGLFINRYEFGLLL